MKILITSGGTKVPIDEVRFIGNMSSGRYGAALERWFMEKDQHVTFFHEKGSLTSNYIYINNDGSVNNPHRIVYKNYNEYLSVIDLALTQKPDIIISAAAVSDYIVDPTQGKISSDKDELVITLKKAQKILPEFKKVSPKSMVVGFKLLVNPPFQDVVHAVQKVLNNGADFVVYNDLQQIRNGNDTRLLFRKDLSFIEAKTAQDLTQIILNEHFTWSDR